MKKEPLFRVSPIKQAYHFYQILAHPTIARKHSKSDLIWFTSFWLLKKVLPVQFSSRWMVFSKRTWLSEWFKVPTHKLQPSIWLDVFSIEGPRRRNFCSSKHLLRSCGLDCFHTPITAYFWKECWFIRFLSVCDHGGENGRDRKRCYLVVIAVVYGVQALYIHNTSTRLGGITNFRKIFFFSCF